MSGGGLLEAGQLAAAVNVLLQAAVIVSIHLLLASSGHAMLGKRHVPG